MNRQIPINNFFVNLSPSIKLISSITILGYLLSYSETAVQVRDISAGSFFSLTMLNQNYLLDVRDRCLFVLGFERHSRESFAVDIRDMDCIYLLLPRNPYMGSSYRHRLRHPLPETGGATMGSTSSDDFLRCGEF